MKHNILQKPDSGTIVGYKNENYEVQDNGDLVNKNRKITWEEVLNILDTDPQSFDDDFLDFLTDCLLAESEAQFSEETDISESL
jgi:hypothetical protein